MSIRIFIGTSLLLAWLLIGCKGEPGPNGMDASIADSTPPVVDWVSVPNSLPDTLKTTFDLKVRVQDDVQVWQVFFYVGGFEFPPDSALSSGALFGFRWKVADFPKGPYVVTARAWDTSGLIGSSRSQLVQVGR